MHEIFLDQLYPAFELYLLAFKTKQTILQETPNTLKIYFIKKCLTFEF